MARDFLGKRISFFCLLQYQHGLLRQRGALRLYTKVERRSDLGQHADL